MRAMRFSLIAGVLLTVATLATSVRGQGGPAPVRVAPVLEEVLQERSRVTGSLRAAQRTDVASNEEGLVRRVHVNEGDRVEAGELLVELDRRRLESEMRRLDAEARVAQAMVTVRTAEQTQAQSDLDSLLALDSRRAAQPKELLDARTAVAIAQARVDEATLALEVISARRDLMQIRLDDTSIVAPHRGVIVRRLVEPGQWIGIGDELCEIVGTDALEAWLDVPQRLSKSLQREDATVRLEITAATMVAPAVRVSVIPRVDETARTFQALAALANDDGILLPGMSVVGWVPAGVERTYVTLPRDALMQNETGYYVFVPRPGAPGGGMQAIPTPIRVLFETESRIVVAGGVRPGDSVVVEGNERLYPTAPISVTNPAAAGGGA